MFSVSQESSLAVKSSWQADLPLTSRGTQTDSFKLSEGSTQHPVASSSASQTSLISPGPGGHSGLPAQLLLNNGSRGSFDIEKLRQFLARTLPITLQEIKESCRVSENWHIMNRLLGHYEESALLLHSIGLEHLDLPDTKALHSDYTVTDIKWNCSASMIVVSYAVGNHKEWCSHSSFLLLWSLYRSFDRNSHPSVTIEVEGCITFVCSHPNHTTVYSVGTSSGKILVLNSRFGGKGFPHPVSGSGNFVRSMNPSNIHHEDAITCLHWMPGNSIRSSFTILAGYFKSTFSSLPY